MNESIDLLFSSMLVAAIAIFLSVIIILVRALASPAAEPTEGNSDRRRVVRICGVVLTTTALVLTFSWGLRGYVETGVPPADALEIRVLAQSESWDWSFTYPGGFESDELVLPVGRPVRLTMTATATTHTFSVPQLRVRRSLVPGRYSVIWIRANELTVDDEEGRSNYVLSCAEYCGTRHASMQAQVRVVSPDAWLDWLESQGGLADQDPVAYGRVLYRTLGCASCHRTTSAVTWPNIGPPLFGLYGRRESFVDGSTLDLVGEDYDEYIRESLISPGERVVEGFSSTMSPYSGRLNDVQITGLIEYLRSLEE